MKKHCCKTMTYHVNYRCPVHPDPYDCSDNLIVYNKVFDEYGLIIHNGSKSKVVIDFCPWCGKAMPSKRDLWFEELKRLGYESPFQQDIPKEYQTDEWYRDFETVDEQSNEPETASDVNIPVVDILAELYSGKISAAEAYKTYEKVLRAGKLGLGEGLVMSRAEMTAFAHGTEFEAIAKWRYEGWPNICPVCGQLIIIENFGWMARHSGKKHVIVHVMCLDRFR